ncbi:MAG: hypothetical protein QOG59_3023, partial [Solirubrobacteraceae bacterium]|nr:hypothetical protein [Solirubrobacteraceae bacterium]
IYTDAGNRYEVGSYDGSVVLVRPRTTADALAAQGADAMWGWNRYVSDLQVCDVPGDHLNHLNRPHVHALAQAIRPHVERAIAGGLREPPHVHSG